ncbi:hypothetical protein SAMN02745866_04011 [Alteromonadaceae bacterium Bs31]|nr:hypothetical protein SAMN02745866_04011 [Alteromonadaceae bacterium Bs31]
MPSLSDSPPHRADNISAVDISQAISLGTQRYFDGCRNRVPAFVKEHFLFPGSWHTNRVALGWDLLRAPLNLFWAPVYAFTSILRFFLNKAGHVKTASLLKYVPEGFTTEVQKKLAVELYSGLLKLDCEQSKLERCISEALQELYADSHGKATADISQKIQSLVHEAIQQYRITRTATSDITNTITSTLLGAFAFYKFTPGGIGIGIVLATLLAKFFAVKDFFLGETLGNIYFYFFPPEPAFSLAIYSTLTVMAVLSIFASFSGLITDPIQAAFKLHHKRLYNMLDHLERDFLHEQGVNSYYPKDQYIARLLDVFDLVKSNFRY